MPVLWGHCGPGLRVRLPGLVRLVLRFDVLLEQVVPGDYPDAPVRMVDDAELPEPQQSEKVVGLADAGRLVQSVRRGVDGRRSIVCIARRGRRGRGGRNGNAADVCIWQAQHEGILGHVQRRCDFSS